MPRRSSSTCRPSRCSRPPSGRAPTPTTPPTPNTRTATGSARSRCYSRSTSSTSRRCSFWRGSCTAPMSPTIATRHRSRAACSRSPKASTCSTSVTTASSSCRCRSTTRSTPGARTRSQAPARATEVSLARVGFIAIPPGAKPGFDHADVHPQRRRLYVAHTGADRIELLDCNARTYLHALRAELPRVAGVLIDEQQDLLFSSDRGAARVSVFACSDEELHGQVEVGPHPNGLAYDRERRQLYSFNLGEPLGENCTASIVGLDSMGVIAELPLPGRPRWAVYDPERDVIYANIQQPAQIVVIDCERALIEHALEVPSAGPHGLWLDSGRLFCAADGGELAVLERDSGEVIASLPLPGVPDVVMHDPELERLYVAIGEPGLVCSFDTNRLEQLETVETEQGAHTSCWDPISQCLYVFCPASGGAAIYEERA